MAERAHLATLGKAVEISARPPASDACELVAHGIPSLNYGVSGRTPGRSGLRQTDWDPGEGDSATTREELGIAEFKPKEYKHEH